MISSHVVGTIYVYTIARSLMSVGQSAKVLEYLLWAANSMETAIALLTVKYLSWRVTLYAAVCQCYYDCKAGAEAEVSDQLINCINNCLLVLLLLLCYVSTLLCYVSTLLCRNLPVVL